MQSNEATLAEYRKFLSFVEKKLAEADSGLFKIPQSAKLELEKDAASLKRKIVSLEGDSQCEHRFRLNGA